MMNRKYKAFQPIFIALVLVLGIWIGYFLTRSSSDAISFPTFSLQDYKLGRLLQLVQENYVDSINFEELQENAIQAVLQELDPHSVYISKEELQSVEEEMQGSFGGIGVEFNIQEDSIVVVTTVAGGPSEKLGIKSGDRIVKVDGENVAGVGITNNDVMKKLRGEIGSKVEVSIKRGENRTLLQYNIKRSEIPLYSLDTKLMLNDEIGYIKLNRFSASTYEEFINAGQFLKQQGMRKLILDLRGNPGGYLDAAIQISNQFLKAKQLIVFTKGRDREPELFFADNEGLFLNNKVVILIDEGSASASEIVAGALQDNDRAKIIGRRSFGKGLVQEQIPLSDGSAVRLTTQKYYTPTGRCIQRPYEKGKTEEYYLEAMLQEKKAETNIPDSLIFRTPKGKIVYGGGGIIPDVLVEKDTTIDENKLIPFYSTNWIFDFCFEFADKNRSALTMKTIKTFDFWKYFKGFVHKKDPNFVFDLNEKEKTYLTKQLQANIGRNLFGNEFYFSIITAEDPFVQRAVQELNN